MNSRHSQSGFSLVEVMTATAIFAIIFIAALLVYDRSNRMFSQNTQAADMQQSTRVGYEKLLSDVRMVGFDYKRAGIPTSAYIPWRPSQAYVVGQMVLPSKMNGHIYKCTTAGTSGATGPTTWGTTSGATVNDGATLVWTEVGTITAAFDQPDEQIEYAWSSAITLRANYDYDTADDATLGHYDHGRESKLESTYFPVVTTGNHEIVTYALVSNAPGATNSDTIQFYADVNNGGNPSRTAYPGGNSERQISVTGVDLSNNNPPYTLYRFTLADNGSVVRTPLADNIRSLNFDYFQDAQGTQHLQDTTPADITNVGGDGQFDPSTPSTASDPNRLIRGNIRSIKVTLVGMNPAPDPNYTDSDAKAPHYRKMTLSTMIVPRNLGIVAMQQSATQPPPAPINVTVCSGYCGVAAITWTPGDPSTYATGSTGAESYAIAYDTDSAGKFANYFPAGTLTTYAIDLTQMDLTKDYYFKVLATNSVGSTSSTVVGPVSLKNATKPAASTLAANGVLTPAPHVDLSWSAPKTNASGTPSCTSGVAPYATVPAEIQGFRLYRSTSSGFTPSAGNLLLDVGAAGPVADGVGGWTYTDSTVTSCTPYYYKIQAVEWCAASDAMNTSGDKSDGNGSFSSEVSATVSAYKASTPTGLTVDPSSKCTTSPNQCTPIKIYWTKVTTDTSGATINVDTYEIWRRLRHGVTTGSYAKVATLSGQTSNPSPISWSEPAALQDQESNGDQDYYDYYVIAESNCGNSDPSGAVTVPNVCNTGVTISQSGAASGAGTSASPWISTANSAMVIHLNAPIKPITAATLSIDGGAPIVLSSPWTYSIPDTGDSSVHSLTFTVTTDCQQTLTSAYFEGSGPGCHLQIGSGIVTVNASPPSGYKELDIKLTNLVSGDVLTVTSLQFSVSVPKKGNLNRFRFPSGADLTNGASPTNFSGLNGGNGSATTYSNEIFNISSMSAADRTINGSGTLTIKLLYTTGSGGGSPAASDITNLSVTYTQSSGGSQTCSLF
ncbi:MAG TPA: prepilin-type N-terminal cleavage/methylation domain-containing protein [Thermoanaerobaculia bacterium]|jgi:prepilin-type N-terminal cleavage/methylation domain-containing protein|nr:prepilin-type N-terminal cleavage/methylation domain-containing protein [Thermoanaerobaculia bacterium]